MRRPGPSGNAEVAGLTAEDRADQAAVAMANRPVSLRDRDRAHLWHPATHFADLDRLPVIPIDRALGCWLYDESGGRLLDAIASWWTCVHGHGHPAIVAAIRAQAERLDHVMFAGFTHAPAIELAESLLELAPPGLAKVFFADCGSAAVEVALKLSYQRHQQIGESRRRRFATLRNSYHGETLGALALCGSGPYRDSFAPLLFDALELPAPAFPAHRPEDSDGDLGANTPEADAAVALLERHAAELSAVVVEPLVQCAGRMAMTGTGFYRRLAATANRLGIDVIADEIAVGFGRTGRLFASSWAGVTPDFLCLSKGLAGVLPLAAVLIRAGFEDAFTGAPGRSFLHSHTFTANPITCAAALAGLRLFRDGDLLARLPARVAAMATRREAVAAACPEIVQQRQIGMISAFQVDPSRTPADGRLGLRLRAAALERGVLLRPLHDTIYWLPPLVIDDAELDLLAEGTIAAVHTALA